MQQRTLGRGGPAVSAIGYGAMGINLAYGPSDEATSIRAIQRARDLGVTCSTPPSSTAGVRTRRSWGAP